MRMRNLGARRRALLLVLVRDLLADLFERAADEARDVHLRDPHLLGDLRLGQALEEPQVEDLPLPFVQGAEAGREHGPVLRDLVLVLLGAERLQRVNLALLVLARARRKGERAVGATALERLQHLLLADLRRLGELGNRGRAAELDRELLQQPRELDVELLEPARDAHRPAAVAEVALDLADDVRRRVGGQLDAAVDVEAVDRLDQADRADLDEILEMLTAVRVTACEGPHERHVLLDQLLSRLEVALLVVAAQEDLVVLLRHARRSPAAPGGSSSSARPTARRPRAARPRRSRRPSRARGAGSSPPPARPPARGGSRRRRTGR